MKYIQLIIVTSLLFISKNFSQEFTNEYVDSIDGFCLVIPQDFHIKKRIKSNLSHIYDNDGNIFATIHLLHLSDIYQKYELKDKSKYHEMIVDAIKELMNRFEMRSKEAELVNNLDSLIESTTSNDINYFVAYHHQELFSKDDKTEFYFVQPHYFVELLNNKDAIILIFKYMDGETNKKDFVLNITKHKLMLNIINSVTLYKN